MAGNVKDGDRTAAWIRLPSEVLSMSSRPDPGPSPEADVTPPSDAASAPGTGPEPPATDPQAVAFSTRTPGPSKLRVGAVAGAAVALAVGAVATSLAASPAPSSSGGTPSSGGAVAPAPFAALDPTLDASDPGLDLGRFGGRGGFGDITITSISGSNLNLTTADGWTRTIAVPSSVALTRAGQAITLADLKTGDRIRFQQTRNSDGTYTVTAIAIVVPTVVGTVGDVTANGFTLKARDGSTWTVAVTGSTTYALGSGTGSKSDVVAGARVFVQGDSPAANQLTALRVQVAADRTVGTVTAKTANSITIKTRDGSTKTIHVGSGTTYRVAGKGAASLSDIAVDMVVGVEGRARSDGSIDATAVAGGTGRGPGKGLFGRLGHGPFADWGGPNDQDASPGATPSANP
jgi:hypothetical protein